MQVLATFDAAGLPTGFWPQDGHGPDAPDDAVELTEAQWQEFVQNPGLRHWDGAQVAVYAPPVPPVVPPDCLSLPWWRTALKLWTRTVSASGAVVTRYADVDVAIKALETATNADGTPNVAVQRLGILAREQFEYANTVLLADLLKLAPAFGFTPADCAESLWRADRVRQGDLTGTWPVITPA